MGKHDVGLVTIRIADGLRSLRYHAESDAIYEAFVRARETCKVSDGFRVLQYSVQSDHLHLLVEASCDGDLQTGMRRLMACLGNALRRLWGMTGSVFADRYHLEVIQSPTRMRNALCYVFAMCLLCVEQRSQARVLDEDGSRSLFVRALVRGLSRRGGYGGSIELALARF